MGTLKMIGHTCVRNTDSRVSWCGRLDNKCQSKIDEGFIDKNLIPIPFTQTKIAFVITEYEDKKIQQEEKNKQKENKNLFTEIYNNNK